MDDIARTSSNSFAEYTADYIVAGYAAAQMGLQRAISNGTALDINTALAQIGMASGADRAYLFRVQDLIFIHNTHEWCRPGISAMQGELQQVPISVGEAFWTGFALDNLFILEDVVAMAFGSELRQALMAQNIRSLLAAPLWQDGEVRGFVGLDYVTAKHRFTPREKALLQGFAATLDAALHSHEHRRMRHRLQADLQSARDRIAAMVTAIPELLVETDDHGVVIGFNQSEPLTFALSPEEVIGQPLEAFLPTHAAWISRKAIAEARQNGWSNRFDYTLQIDGQPKRFTLHVTASGTSPGGGRTGYLFVVRDITESFWQDTRIRQLGRAAELSTNLIMLTDAGRRITWMNPATVSRSGVSLDAAIGQLPSDILRYGKGNPAQVESLCALLEQGQDVLEEVQAFDSRDIPYWLNLNVQALRDRDGVTHGFMVIGNDVTAQKLAEVRALRDRQMAMDASRDGIAISQPDGQLSYINPKFREFLGLPAEAKPAFWHDIDQNGVNPDLVTILPELYASGHWTSEVCLQTTAARERYFDVSMSVQDDGSFLTIAREITDRKAAEEQQARLREQLQIAQSRQLVAQLAGGLAHDVANVLAVIAQSLEMLKPVSTPPANQHLERIEAAAGQAQALVGNLTRLGQRSAPKTKFDFGQIIGQAADLFRPGLQRQIGLTVDLPQDPVIVAGDTTSAMQVMLNLMLNARDALVLKDTPAPTITVTLRMANAAELLAPVDLGVLIEGQPYALVEICDTGMGIAPEIQQHILEPYFTTKGTQGAGLGLTIVADILEAHQGALRMHSEPGIGTNFTVFWPVGTAHLNAIEEKGDTGRSLEGMQVLLVDNDEAMLIALTEKLTRAGAEPVSCNDSLEALDAVRADPQSWHAVVTDHDMTSMTGSELATRLNAVHPDLPVIMVTGAKKLPSTTNSAITAVLRKPVSDPVLVAVLLKAKLRHLQSSKEKTDASAPADRG